MIGEFENLVKWKNFTTSKSLRKSPGDTLCMYGFEKQGYSNINYEYVDDIVVRVV